MKNEMLMLTTETAKLIQSHGRVVNIADLKDVSQLECSQVRFYENLNHIKG